MRNSAPEEAQEMVLGADNLFLYPSGGHIGVFT